MLRRGAAASRMGILLARWSVPRVTMAPERPLCALATVALWVLAEKAGTVLCRPARSRQQNDHPAILLARCLG